MPRIQLLSTVAMLALLAACSTCPLHIAKANKLKPGVRYEVRKAIAAGDTFQPHLLTSYFFVVNSPHAPMLAARNASHTPAPIFSSFTSDRPRGGDQMNVRTTAYTHTESDHLVYGKKNAIGTPLKFGYVRSAAADWSRFPLGTRFRIAGQPQIYEVDDYGSALVGTGTIDLYKPTRGMMNAWGVRHVDIEVLQWGSFERSHQMLKERTRYPHVRQMFNNIQRQINQASLKTKPSPATAVLSPSAGIPLASL
jgi:3D (Asp-Asp-Asp) domain-containing protein